MGFLSRTGAIADEGSAAGPGTSLGTRAGLVRVFAEEPLPPAVPFTSRRVLVGREPDCQLILQNHAVSRRQAELVYAGGVWTLSDTESRNGTFVNGELTRRAALKHGDLIRFGDTLFAFVRVDADGYEKHEAEEHGGLLGGYRVHRLVQAIGRVAPSAIPVRLRGERGSEMDAAAALLHARSGRGGELRVIRCSQRDIGEIGSALFAAPKPIIPEPPPSASGPYRRPGEVPSGIGTVFFDDVDIAPNTVEWIARTSARHPGFRFVFGTPTWVEESPLWRYTINLVGLRDRKEDVVPICRDELLRLGRGDLTLDVTFVAAVIARGLDGGVETLRRLVRSSVERCRGPRLMELG